MFAKACTALSKSLSRQSACVHVGHSVGSAGSKCWRTALPACSAAAPGLRHASTAVASDLALTPEQLEFFTENGYLVVENYWDAATCKKLMATANKLVDDFEPEDISIFSTKEQTRTSDDYFLESGGEVRFFFEEDAFDADGQLTVDKSVAINKIGHALHDKVPEFTEVTYTKRAAAMLNSLGYQMPLPVQSMYIFKQPGIGGEVTPHQDGTFLYTVPQTCIGMWWALEDCTTSNGCLYAVPGSHKSVPVERWFRRNPDGPGTVFEPAAEPEPLPTQPAACLETKAGTLVLLHGGLVHFSDANLSPASRHAYSVHIVEGGQDVKYPAENWLQRAEPFNTFEEFADEAARIGNVGVQKSH